MRNQRPWWLLAATLVLTIAVYTPGLSGSWLFDDYPNIVNNHAVQPPDASVANLVGAALSSPSSRFKRPLASLTFAANYLAGGLDPFGWKLVNLAIHLGNGVLVFLLMRLLLAAVAARDGEPEPARVGVLAALIAAAWMLLPINLTGVLYVVQRMASLANLFVLAGLIGYLRARHRMLAGGGGFGWCIASLVVPVAIGITAKETAVMLPLYAFLVEWLVFGFARAGDAGARADRRLVGLFVAVLWLPMIAGLAWLGPHLLRASTWATRDFSLGTRLLSEARAVVDYIAWTLVPLPRWLSFYHDDFVVSQGLLKPWTTLTSIVAIVALLALGWRLRRKRPLVALGIGWYFGCHLLTGTVLPLELVYEHRNYFASLGLLVALLPLLLAPRRALAGDGRRRGLPWPLARRSLALVLALWWVTLTALTAWSWGDPLRLAATLADRAPRSPRAQYEYGRSLIVASRYQPYSPYTPLVYAPLERAAALPKSSILPQQALLFFNARMHRPQKAKWWDSLIAKLKARPPGVQDGSSLVAMTQCATSGSCRFDQHRMVEAFEAALAHPQPSARIYATYADYAWNVLHDYPHALALIGDAVDADPDEPAYRLSLARMAAWSRHPAIVAAQIKQLERLNYGGRLDRDIAELKRLSAHRQ